MSPTLKPKDVTVDAFLLCWNEEKIIRHSLNYYKTFCRKITVIDNESSDETLEILKKEYPDVEVVSFSTGGVLRDDVHQHIKNTCWKTSNADWCIVADMDELLYHSNILWELYLRKKAHQSLPTVHGYNMFSETFLGDYSKLITDQLHMGIPEATFNKYILINRNTVKEIRYAPGAHSVMGLVLEKKVFQKMNDYKAKENFKLLHYKYLGENYLIEKHRKLAARLSSQNKEMGWGAQYLKPEEDIKRLFKFFRESNKVIKVI